MDRVRVRGEHVRQALVGARDAQAGLEQGCARKVRLGADHREVGGIRVQFAVEEQDADVGDAAKRDFRLTEPGEHVACHFLVPGLAGVAREQVEVAPQLYVLVELRHWGDGSAAAGTRRVEVLLERGRVARAAAEMGPVELGTPFAFALEGLAREVHPARVGNPHAGVFVPDAASAPLGLIGPAVERHPRFPERANVEVVSRAPEGGLAVRVWERGVGETAACGTGACAAACVAAERLGLAPPIEVRMPGGLLLVDWSDLESVTLAGPVQREGTIQP